MVAVKVIKNQAAYYHQARVEIGVLQFLNTRGDPTDESHIVRLKDFFLHKNHLCLVFELLNLNLFELIRHNRFRGLSLPLVRVFLSQILKALVVLNRSNIIHCDIKPENILLTDATSGEVKLIDFGSACFSSRTVYTYIQSRFYRSPEVVLGHQYTMSVDMWSLGCVAAELFLGLPLFPAACELDLLHRITETIGTPPEYVLEQAKNTSKFFTTTPSSDAPPGIASNRATNYTSNSNYHHQSSMRLKTAEEFVESTGQKAPQGKQYFQHKALANIIHAYPFRQGLNELEIRQESARRESFTDFLLGLLTVDPVSRWTPRQAQMHPFIIGSTYTGPFQPIPDPLTSPTHATVSVSAVQGVPIGIPQTRVHATTAAMATTPSALDSIAAAVVASSPQMHAQAHAAAMAAVQMQMNMQQQQQQGRSIPIYNRGNAAGAGAGGAVASSSSPYIAAHSLQRIMDPPLVPSSSGLPGLLATRASTEGTESHSNQWQVGSYPSGIGAVGGAGHPSTSSGSFLNNPAAMSLFSPPSRSFGVHLQSMASGDQLPPPSFDPGYSSSPHRIMPLMHSGREQPDSSPIPFQPSSVSTYRSTLAATAAAAGAMLPSARQQQYQQHQFNASTAAATARNREPLQRTAGFVVPGSTPTDGGGHLPEAMSIPLEPSHSPLSPPHATAVGDGENEDDEASPPENHHEDDDEANPDADWDPLWTDDVLTEEESFDHTRSTGKNIEGNPSSMMPMQMAMAGPSPNNKDSSLSLAVQHLTQLQPLNTTLGGASVSWPIGSTGVGGVRSAATVEKASREYIMMPTPAAANEEPCSPHGSLMEGISHAENMMWSPPRTAVAAILKANLPDGGSLTVGQQQQQQQVPLPPPPPPGASQLEPLQRLHGFVVSTDQGEEEKAKGNDEKES
jgi:dual specificity protein kinase YAK1